MAKTKKRTKNDARGYTRKITSSKTATPSTVVVGKSKTSIQLTKQANDEITSILDQMKGLLSTSNEDFKQEPIVSLSLQDKKQVKRIAMLNDQLEHYKFQEKDILRFFCALCHGEAIPWYLQRTVSKFHSGKDNPINPFDLDLALDWLCYHVDSQDLPPLFRQEIMTRSDDTNASSGISVDKRHAVVTHHWKNHERSIPCRVLDDETANVILIQETKSSSVKDEQEERLYCNSHNDEEQKQRILAQYAYIEDSDDEDDEEEMHSDEQDPQVEKGSMEINDNTERTIQRFKPDQTTAEKTVEEVKLEKLEQKMKEDYATLNDDVSCYMMSKHEIKELKASLKKNEQVAKGLRAKIEKMKQKQALETSHSQNVTFLEDKMEEEEDVFGSNIFDMPSATIMDTVASSVGPTLRKPIRRANIGKWSGTNPKDLLLDICRKNKYHVPKFTKLSNTDCGCSLRIHLPSRELNFQDEGPFESYTDAQQFVACEALYHLEPDKPLYKVLPPVFQDIWKSWMKQKHNENISEIESKEAETDEKVAALIQRIQEHTENPPVATNKQEESNNGEILSDWDEESVESVESEHNDNQNKQQNDADKEREIGEKMRTEFLSRQKLDTYTQMLKDRRQLPIFDYRDTILDAVEHSDVTILCAETGAGKSTQAVQMILEDALSSGHGGKVNIICTQPRRIAAISVAERVAEEMGYDIGGLVGYQIRGESKVSRKTVLSFCTTGVLLRRLQDDPALSGVTHILIDECHERQWQIDFLIIALRRLLRKTRMDLKVILMSATIDTKLFLNFFDGFRVELLQIPGRTFPVNDYYLEDVLDATGHVIEENSYFSLKGKYQSESESSVWVTTRGGGKERVNSDLDYSFDESDMYSNYSLSTRRSMQIVDEKKINFDLIEDLLLTLLDNTQKSASIIAPNVDKGREKDGDDGSVLIFLPGIGEIRALYQRLSINKVFGDKDRFLVLSMHSSISSKEQKRAFLRPKVGCRKIILATNICEASLTIPDCVVVIDTGLERSVRQNNRTSTPTLVTDWCSKASAKQRAGRAGRVRPGICCKLYSSHTATKIMKHQSIPELQRIPLEEVCLAVLSSHLSDNCFDFLSQAPQPPSSDAVKSALTVLENVNAIEPLSGQNLHTRKEVITPLGAHLARLPIDVRLGKMLIFGCLFRSLDKILTIVSCLSTSKPLFSTSMEMSAESEAAHKSFRHPTCDFLTYCNIFDAFSNSSNKIQFCSKYYLNKAVLMEVSDLRKLFVDQLKMIGFISDSTSEDNLASSSINIHGRNEAVIITVITAGLYPNCAHRVKGSDGSYDVFHKNEKLWFHSSSTFFQSKIPREWIVYHEKFATYKTFIANASAVPACGILLFGKNVSIQYVGRKVIIDDWIELGIPAQIAVFFREARIGISLILKNMLVIGNHSEETSILDNIVRLIELEELSNN